MNDRTWIERPKCMECEKPATTRGYCKTCYARNVRNGTLRLQNMSFTVTRCLEMVDGKPCNGSIYKSGLCRVHFDKLAKIGVLKTWRQTRREKAKLNEDQIREIRKTFAKHARYKKLASETSHVGLAKKYGVSDTFIRDIVQRKIYKDIK